MSNDLFLWVRVLKRVTAEAGVSEDETTEAVQELVESGETIIEALQHVAESIYLERIFPKRQSASFKDWMVKPSAN